MRTYNRPTMTEHCHSYHG